MKLEAIYFFCWVFYRRDGRVIRKSSTFKSSWGDLSQDDLYSWLKKPEQKDAFVIFAHPGFIFY